EEQVAHSLVDLSKKKRTTDQFILVRRDQTPPDSTTGPSSQPDDDTSDKMIHESSSTSDSERTESETDTAAPKDDKDQGEVDSSTVSSGVSIPVSEPEKAHEALAGPDPEPMKEDQTGSDSGKLHVSLAGPNPEHMDEEFLATAYPKIHENLKLITDERGDEWSDLWERCHQTVTSTPPVIAPFTNVSSTKPSSLVTPPPINTEATTITTSLPEITPFIAFQLRVARLEQEMSEVKKTDHSADVLASIKSQVPMVILHCLEQLQMWQQAKLLLRSTELQKNPSSTFQFHITRTQTSVFFRAFTASANSLHHLSAKLKKKAGAREFMLLDAKSCRLNLNSSPHQRRQCCIQTLTPAEQEAADIMKALKESKKMSKRQPGTGASNEGTGNILGVPDESTVISRASSEGTGSKPGVPDDEKLIL
ncbi:hypothetical protein Tco_1093727, partial [Tanacetum coccineum]